MWPNRYSKVAMACLLLSVLGCSSSPGGLASPQEVSGSWNSVDSPVYISYSSESANWSNLAWLELFGEELLDQLVPPYAYRLGVVVGYTKIQLQVSESGIVSETEVVDSAGHESLHTASLDAVAKASAAIVELERVQSNELLVELVFNYPAVEQGDRE